MRHTALFTAFRLSFGLTVALGFGRFAYALLLPPMRSALGWGYTEAGLMNTANAVGYLSGSVLAPILIRQLGLRPAFRWGMLITAISVLSMSLASRFGVMLALRGLTGFTGAVVFIAAGTLISLLAAEHPAQTGLLIGLNVGGVGIGIMLSGLLLPLALATGDAEHWRIGWVILGVLSLAACFMAATPWQPQTQLPQPTAPATQTAPAPSALGLPHLIPALMAYFMFGLGYVSYMTFIIAFLQSQGVTPLLSSLVFGALGGGVVVSSFVWRGVIERAHRGLAIAATMGATALATLLPLMAVSLPAVFASSVVFGLSFLAVVSAVTALVRRALPKSDWTRGLATFTVAFALGQSFGPTITGALSDWLGGLNIGLAFSAAVLALGVILGLAQRRG
ncbi:MAG: YbfB/YjiJ family MFS transporter [Anaerolineae bacterium]|nr:YbfB/YjiJ family MFS transporter [Anaerolineae bacterium]